VQSQHPPELTLRLLIFTCGTAIEVKALVLACLRGRRSLLSGRKSTIKRDGRLLAAE
jgi:hypothetical protein